MDNGFVSDFGEVHRSVKAFGFAISTATRHVEEMGKALQGLHGQIRSIDSFSAATAKIFNPYPAQCQLRYRTTWCLQWFRQFNYFACTQLFLQICASVCAIFIPRLINNY